MERSLLPLYFVAGGFLSVFPGLGMVFSVLLCGAYLAFLRAHHEVRSAVCHPLPQFSEPLAQKGRGPLPLEPSLRRIPRCGFQEMEGALGSRDSFLSHNPYPFSACLLFKVQNQPIRGKIRVRTQAALTSV